MRTLPSVGHRIPKKTIGSGWIVGLKDPDIKLFNNFQEVVYTSSGSAALCVALQACKMTSKRRQVIIPAYTCPSVLAAVERVGLQAVMCDLAPGELELSESQIVGLLNENTLAVVFVHLYGLDRRSSQIKKLLKDAGVLLIEDAAQAFANRAEGVYLGTDGDLSILSFGRGKPISSLHGGAVIVNNMNMVSKVKDAMGKLATPLPAWFGIYYRMLITAYFILFNPRLFKLPQAMPWYKIGETVYLEKINIHRMSKSAKRVLSSLLKERKAIQQRRSKWAEQYIYRLKPYAKKILYTPTLKEIKTGPIRFPVVLKDKYMKENLLNKLVKAGLGASGSYPTPLNKQSGVPKYVSRQGPFPNADDIAGGMMTLPTHDLVMEHDFHSIIKILEDGLRK